MRLRERLLPAGQNRARDEGEVLEDLPLGPDHVPARAGDHDREVGAPMEVHGTGPPGGDPVLQIRSLGVSRSTRVPRSSPMSMSAP
jgi:hypothetical protein